MSTYKNKASCQTSSLGSCPCGTAKMYSVCCGIYIEGKSTPETPEALMRSRYTAYTQANIEYIANTMKGPALQRFNAERAYQWASQAEWIKLEVIKASLEFTVGFVEFIAYFKEKGEVNTIHEMSEFHFEDGAWFYIDGKHL